MSDLVLYNARIHTVDPTQPTARSIAIRDKKILALGNADALRSLLPDAEVIDVHDRCVMPGLIDARRNDEVYVIFPQRVVKYRKGDQAGRTEAQEYARSIGIPVSQIDWSD